MEYLVDVNLPRNFRFFNAPNFEFVHDINKSLPDHEIWEYAIKNNKIIITKDTDFYNKAILSTVKAKVIFIKLGNVTLKQLHQYFTLHWEVIEQQINLNYLVIAMNENILVLI